MKRSRPTPFSSGCGSQQRLVQSVRSRIDLGNDNHVMQTQSDPDYTTAAHRGFFVGLPVTQNACVSYE